MTDATCVRESRVSVYRVNEQSAPGAIPARRVGMSGVTDYPAGPGRDVTSRARDVRLGRRDVRLGDVTWAGARWAA